MRTLTAQEVAEAQRFMTAGDKRAVADKADGRYDRAAKGIRRDPLSEIRWDVRVAADWLEHHVAMSKDGTVGAVDAGRILAMLRQAVKP